MDTDTAAVDEITRAGSTLIKCQKKVTLSQSFYEYSSTPYREDRNLASLQPPSGFSMSRSKEIFSH
jgi:hypothetical protein